MENMKQVHFIEMDLDRNGEQRLLDETEELRKKMLVVLLYRKIKLIQKKNNF